jgi:hypothetical protein
MSLESQMVLRDATNPTPVVFPRTCVISLITRTHDGQSINNAIIGYEGLYAFQSPAGNIDGVVQMDGLALGMTRDAFEKHLDTYEFRVAVDSYHQRLLALTCQSALCHTLHTAEQRLARWLLSMRDRSDNDELLITQDHLANMLGVHRPTVTIAARILQAGGMIHYRYGRVGIVNRAALEEVTCECYHIVPKPDDPQYASGASPVELSKTS